MCYELSFKKKKITLRYNHKKLFLFHIIKFIFANSTNEKFVILSLLIKCRWQMFPDFFEKILLP